MLIPDRLDTKLLIRVTTKNNTQSRGEANKKNVLKLDSTGIDKNEIKPKVELDKKNGPELVGLSDNKNETKKNGEKK